MNPYQIIKQKNLELRRKEEENAGLKQAGICCCFSVCTAFLTLIASRLDALPWWGYAAATGLMLFFLCLAAAYSYLPTVRQNRQERSRLYTDNGSYVDP